MRHVDSQRSRNLSVAFGSVFAPVAPMGAFFARPASEIARGLLVKASQAGDPELADNYIERAREELLARGVPQARAELFIHDFLRGGAQVAGFAGSAPGRRGSKQVEAAVKAYQLWLGSQGTVRPEQEARLLARAMAAADRIAKSKRAPFSVVQDQLLAEAQRRGRIRPIPGKDI